MPQLIMNGQVIGGVTDKASNLKYDNSISGLQSNNVQDAITELNSTLSNRLNLVTKTITSSTDGNGYLRTGINIAKPILYVNTVNYNGEWLTGYPCSDGVNTMLLHIRKYDGSILSNCPSITFNVTYIDL